MTQKIQHMQLKENWFIDKDPQNCGEKIGWTSKVSEDALPTEVPSIIQETLPEYHGAAFYWCQFIPNICHTEKDRVILRFNGVDYKATVWLNGTWLGAHESGETPFEFDITEKIHIEQENLLAVKVINPVDYDIDGLNRLNVPNRNKTTQKRAGGCLNSGGIWYDVELFTVPAVYITEKQLIGNSETGDLTARISVKNVLSVAQKAELHLNVYGKTGGNYFIVGNMNSVCVDQGQTLVEISTAVPNHQLWDIDDPFLYRVELVLVSDCGEYRESLNFGFRSFAVKNGYFYLNDRKIFLKSAHSGNAFPIGQNYPVVKEQIRRDMIMAKTYGFNMVRAIAGIFRPEQLDVCDEIGLLIYEEAMAAWQLGEWKQFLKDETRSDTDQEKMFTRFDISTLEMIRRDRNHPSVVVWGLLNEMQTRNPITAYAKNFLAKLRAEDETRLVFIDSGRWDGDRRDASASNPYSSEWDVWMGADGTDYDFSTEELRPYFWPNVGDYHYYPDFPISEKDAEHIRNYAHSVQPAFISESGIGPLFNVIEEAKQFQQHGCREDLEDFSWLTKQSRALEADWHRLGLEKVYPFPEMMLKESQRLSAQDRRFLFDLIRSNPKHNGYSLTGLLDHGMCGEGLWSYWRRFKPEVYDVVCDGWSPLRFCLFATHHVYRGQQFAIEAVLANENALPIGHYTTDFAIMGTIGVVESFSVDFEIKDDSFAVPIMKRNITLNVPTGQYALVASLREGGSPLGNKRDFYVQDSDELQNIPTKIYVAGMDRKTIDFLQSKGAELVLFEGQTDGLVLVGSNASEESILTAKKSAECGATVLYLSPIPSENGSEAFGVDHLAISDDFRVFTYRDWLYHKESIAANRRVFAGLGVGICDSVKYGPVYPKIACLTARTPEDVICPAFYTGSPHMDGGYGCSHVLAGFACGAGMLYVNCFDIEQNIGVHPAADLLLLNLIGYLSEKEKV